jgi:exopolysaccharide production protein ExoZ
MNRPGPGVLIRNIQVLRAVAALVVVFLHVTSTGGLSLPASVGHYGVDVFFVISGFIIPYIASHDMPGSMMLKRIIRIVPIYWVATLGLFALASVAPYLLHSTDASLPSLLHSLFFLPYGVRGGDPVPLLINGWTLNYEMYFYVLFAVGLLLARRHVALFCACAVTAVLLLVDFLKPSAPALAFYGRSVVLEFVMGMIAYGLYRRIPWMSSPAGRRDGGFAVLLLVALAAFMFLPLGELLWGGWQALWLRGVPAMALLLSLVVLERRYDFFSDNKALLVLGEASYVLYLLHPYVVFGVLRVFARGATQWPPAAQWLLVVVLMALAAGVSILVHLYFERPVMALLRRRLLHKPQPVIFTPADT